MPEPKTICTGCRRKIVPKGTKCIECTAKGNRGTSKNRSGDPFYASSAWRKLRAIKLANDPLCQCEHCTEFGLTTAADTVDHIKARCDYPELELDYENLASMSAAHHNRKTTRERNRRR